ncbi:hypothetical protein ABW19_dt0209175 [Dactylella cylindrospora]|nr:hypothetical protein ABW19_dt0209175 [Dactylella cylindrospora]
MSLSVAEDVWHILDIAPGSPADAAGLLPYSDYIIGTPQGLVRGESGLGELVEDHIDRPLQLYVYNHEFNVTREVTILPRKHWGGDGALGCVLGYGALHRLPPSLEEPLSQPGEAIFEYPPDDAGEPGPTVNTLITPAFALQQQDQPRTVLPQTFSPPPGQIKSPASLSSAGPGSPPPVMMDPAAIAASQSRENTPAGGPPLSAPPPPPMASPYSQDHVPAQTASRTGRKARGTRNARLNMDAYMQEEENKSKKEDYSLDPGSTTSPPPPGSRPPPPPKKAD